MHARTPSYSRVAHPQNHRGNSRSSCPSICSATQIPPTLVATPVAQKRPFFLRNRRHQPNYLLSSHHPPNAPNLPGISANRCLSQNHDHPPQRILTPYSQIILTCSRIIKFCRTSLLPLK